MTGPLVSVVMPTYNHERYVGSAIQSMLAQTYPNWELVVIDDGSVDRTGEIARSFTADPRVRYVRQENQGIPNLAKTINRGVGMTTGPLVTMFSGDDVWPSRRLELQVPVFDDPAVVFCFGRGHLIDSDGKIITSVRDPARPFEVNRPVGAVLREMLPRNIVQQYTVLIRRTALDRIGGYLQPPGLLAEDYPTHLALALEGEWRFLDEDLGHYRIHAQQHTFNATIRDAETDMPYVLEFFRRLPPGMQSLSGWTEASLRQALEDRVHNAYFEAGRKSMLAGNRRSARQHFWSALRRGNAKTKTKAVVGLTCAGLGLDLERIVRLSGRTPLR